MDRRKEDLGKDWPIAESGAVIYVPNGTDLRSLRFNQRSGTDRRQHNKLEEARNLMRGSVLDEAGFIQNDCDDNRQAIRIILDVLERRK